MKSFNKMLLNVSLFAMFPVFANAAGTYYNGNLYQNPQSKYASGNGGYYSKYGAGRGYGQENMVLQQRTTTVTKTKSQSGQSKTSDKKQGFVLNANLGHEFANWEFDMKQAGSKLHYDNLRWNIISAEGAYYFGNETPMQIKFGARYGKQYGDSSMIDDDISNGGYAYQDWAEGRQTGNAISVGTSNDGSQYGFNVGFGLTDFFRLGRVKMTPSVGYRYLKYELTTKDNYGLTMDTFMGNSSHPFINCISSGGEMQCDPFVLFEFYDASDKFMGSIVTGRLETVDEDGNVTYTSIFTTIPSFSTGYPTSVGVDLGDTYYYRQLGTSHKYETTWMGPYLALDMEYDINSDNFVSGGIELGLPTYNSEGDQPYRVDWMHPKSVEDKAGFGKAYHIGLNALWSTAITNSMMLSFGMTYDYYHVKDADASTFLNPLYYQAILNEDYAELNEGGLDSERAQLLNAEIQTLEMYKAAGWKIENKKEIESVYKSMGLRVGLNIKF